MGGTNAAVWAQAGGPGDAIVAALKADGATVLRGGAGQEPGDIDALITAPPTLDALIVCVPPPRDGAALADLGDADWTAALDRGVGLAFRGIRAALRRMLPQESGRIVIVTSLESKIARPGATADAASHHAIAGLVKSAAHEVGTKGIGINALVCGVLGEPTAPAEEEQLAASALKRPLNPEEVAAAAALLASPMLGSVTATLFPAHGGAIPY
jgi:NAD(P)-dependent dehydrogenase (short-subunit alcohol dehydrogenase family)